MAARYYGRAGTMSYLGNLLIPYGERRRRGTGVPLCYPPAWQRVAVSVCTVVPRARLEVWIGEAAASSLVTTRPVAPGRRRSRWEDCLYPPLPYPLPACPCAAAASPQPLLLSPVGLLALTLGESTLCWRMPCPDASPPRCHPIPPPQPCCRRSTRTPLVSTSGRPSYGSVSRPARSRLLRPRAGSRACPPTSAVSAPSRPTCTRSLPGCGSAR